jgi:hypothetical protein
LFRAGEICGLISTNMGINLSCSFLLGVSALPKTLHDL